MKLHTVLWVGLGGTGSIALEPCLRLLMFHPDGTWKVILADLDSYEEKNAERQLFSPSQIGKNKAVATAERLDAFPNLMVEPVRIDHNTMTELIYKYHLISDEVFVVVSAVDNDASRKVILDATETLPNFILINPGNTETGSQCSIYVRLNGIDRTPNPKLLYPNIAEPSDQLPGSCGEVAVNAPQTITANSFAALSVQIYLRALLYDEPFTAAIHGDLKRGKLSYVGDLIRL